MANFGKSRDAKLKGLKKAASCRKGLFSVKWNRIISLVVICIILLSPITAEAASGITIDSNYSGEGIVRVAHSGTDKKTKVMVEKGSTKYYYDLKKEEDFFPLQLGQGDYTVTVLENITGIKYKAVAQKSFKAEITEMNSVYLQSTQPIVWNYDMESIKLANSLAQGEKDNLKVVQTIYDYIVNNISYDYKKADKLSSDYTPEIDTIFRDGKGICYDYSVLFAAMLRSRGIPAKMVKGYRDGIEKYHAWNEVYLDGRWKVIDATFGVVAIKAGTSCRMFQDEDKYRKLREY